MQTLSHYLIRTLYNSFEKLKVAFSINPAHTCVLIIYISFMIGVVTNIGLHNLGL